MAQVTFDNNLTKTWRSFADIVGTVDADAEYLIQNRGADALVALEAESTPAADNPAGTMIYPSDIGVYKKGEQNLYLRAFDKNCSINVSVGE